MSTSLRASTSGVKRQRSDVHDQQHTVNVSQLFRASILNANKCFSQGNSFLVPHASCYDAYDCTRGTISALFANAGDAALLVHQAAQAAQLPCSNAHSPQDVAHNQFAPPSDFSALISNANRGLAPFARAVPVSSCGDIVKMAKIASAMAARVHSIQKPAAAVIHDPCSLLPVAWVSQVALRCSTVRSKRNAVFSADLQCSGGISIWTIYK
jgi:hypothetical protein